MVKLGRIALLVLAGIIALAAVILLAINLYVQSQGTQERIQHELGERLNTTLRIRRISVTPWAGLKLTGITIPQNGGPAAGAFLEAKAFRLRVRLASLISGPLVIKEISLIEPNVVWTQNAEGKWRVPPPPAGSVIGKTGIVAHELAAASQAPTATAPTTSAPAVSETAAGAGSPNGETENAEPFTPEIKRVQLIDGHFQFLDVKGKLVARFDGVQFRSSFRNAAALRGNASIARTSLRDRFFLEQLQSPLAYDARAMEFSQISARAAGGNVTGSFVLQPQAEDSPFTATIAFRDLAADRVVTDAGGPSGMITGHLEGRMEARGKTADPNALAGAGEIILRDGVVQQYSLLVALAQLLQIEELRQLRLDQAQVKYHISPGVVNVDEVLLRSPNLKLTAAGTIGFDGKLALQSQLAVDQKIRSRLFRPIRENFQPSEEPGFAAVNFDVTGTIDRPKTNLMERLVGRDLKDLGSVINSLLGGGKSDRPKKKKKTAEDPATGTPPPAIDRSSPPAPVPEATASP